MRIVIVGTGYVGLVAGSGFSEFGNDVTCVDSDEDKIKLLLDGEIPIYEPGLDSLVDRNVEAGRLRFTTDLQKAMDGAEVAFIAVGTPSDEDGSADLSHVLEVARQIGDAMTRSCVVVDKSTVPVGTADKVAEVIAARTRQRFHVVSNPEFLKEGHAIEDFMRPDRVVIGANDATAREVMRWLYQPFVRSPDQIICMDVASAELTKYAANAMLATRISFMNELSHLAEKTGGDITAIRTGIGSDSRIGSAFLYAGTGFSGSCFPKDVRALLKTAQENDVPLGIVQAAYTANERQKDWIPQKVKNHFGSLDGKRIAVWGLAFKPDTDDTRESVAIHIVKQLLKTGANVFTYDPQAHNASFTLGTHDRLAYCSEMYEASSLGSDALVLATEWREFRSPDWSRIAAPVIFDGRNIWDPEQVRATGRKYYGVGRP